MRNIFKNKLKEQTEFVNNLKTMSSQEWVETRERLRLQRETKLTNKVAGELGKYSKSEGGV